MCPNQNKHIAKYTFRLTIMWVRRFEDNNHESFTIPISCCCCFCYYEVNIITQILQYLCVSLNIGSSPHISLPQKHTLFPASDDDGLK